MDEALADRRRELLVFAEETPVRADEDLGVEECPECARELLADADDAVRVRVTGGGLQRLDLAARDLDRVLEQLDREARRDAAGRRVEVEPDRVRWNEPLGKADHAGTVATGLTDQRAGLLSRLLAVQKDGGRLDGGHFDGRVRISYGCISYYDQVHSETE